MKKLTKIACLVAALMLFGFATADAWPFWGYVSCYYTCNGDTVRMDTWVGQCCGTQFIRSSDGATCYALWWEQMGITDVCMI